MIGYSMKTKQIVRIMVLAQVILAGANGSLVAMEPTDPILQLKKDEVIAHNEKNFINKAAGEMDLAKKAKLALKVQEWKKAHTNQLISKEIAQQLVVQLDQPEQLSKVATAKQIANKAFGKISTVAAQSYKDLSWYAIDTYLTSKQALKNIANTVINNANNALQGSKIAAQDAVQAVQQEAKEISAVAADELQAAKAGTQEAAFAVRDAVCGAITSGAGYVAQKTNNGVAAVKQVTNEAVKNATWYATDTYLTSKQAVKNSVNTVINNANNALQGSKIAAQDAVQAVKQEAKEISAVVMDELQAAKAGTQEAVATVWSSVSQFVVNHNPLNRAAQPAIDLNNAHGAEQAAAAPVELPEQVRRAEIPNDNQPNSGQNPVLTSNTDTLSNSGNGSASAADKKEDTSNLSSDAGSANDKNTGSTDGKKPNEDKTDGSKIDNSKIEISRLHRLFTNPLTYVTTAVVLPAMLAIARIAQLATKPVAITKAMGELDALVALTNQKNNNQLIAGISALEHGVLHAIAPEKYAQLTKYAQQAQVAEFVVCATDYKKELTATVTPAATIFSKQAMVNLCKRISYGIKGDVALVKNWFASKIALSKVDRSDAQRA